MRKLKSLVIAAVLFLGVNSNMTAQTKVAHINLSELIPLMPEVNAAQDQLKKLAEGFDKDYKAMTAEYQTKAEKYGKEAPTAGDALNETRSRELQDFGARIEKFEQTAQAEIQKKQIELNTPILEKARLAIHKVAKAKGFDMVLDSTPGAGVIMADTGDIFQDVKAELKIK
ncbi:OmpH family outer membrane protein [Paenimyroides tangerinum]|uniref:OmpH family outer membrane protein n=1 Tax=Paenimyroides tangerinum TaxID=2488728 RepID=A0A3P3W7J5_9FLAO|nr:OmpH family outer membrane protein [Paenimyroides tangerinum]RRJ89926.1 OmpH family outer membrane protein [Paenimyroides tangerinum]